MPASCQRRLIFDLSGIVEWYASMRHVTGIQRVAERILTQCPILDDGRALFVARVERSRRFLRLDGDLLALLAKPAARETAIDYLREAYCTLQWRAWRAGPLPNPQALWLGYCTWLRRRRSGSTSAPRAPWESHVPRQGDLIVALADFWTPRDQLEAYRRLKSLGVGFVLFIHDILPATHGGFFRAGHRRRFLALLEEALRFADAILVGSAAVRNAVHQLASGKPLAAKPIEIVHFGWDFPTVADRLGPGEVAEVLRQHGLDRGSYVLQVGTIEPRKNHLLTVRALRRLHTKHGPLVPTVVFVGKKGWKSRELRRELSASPYVSGKIRILHGVSDRELAAFYLGCRFTVFPSHAEGWGLPVQESLSFGKPCLASGVESIRELAGDLVEYIDPEDLDGFTRTFERWMTDDALIAAMAQRIAAALRDRSRLPSWHDTADAVIRIAERIAARQPV